MATKGIDISNHNGSINFNAVKNSGIDFAMIRSSYGWFYKDNNAENYARSCEAVGLPYGFYHYSYATNLEQAKIEVDNFLNFVKNFNPTYPLAIDMEDADGWKARNGNPSNDMCVQICEYFCKRVEEAGYYAMIYANLDWFNNRLNDNRLNRYDKWVAQWSSRCTYSKPYGMWQYADNGRVNGINGNVDMNYAYKDYPAIIKGMGKVKPVQPSTPSQPTSNGGTYTVQKGDTLSGIASKYGTTYQVLAQMNGIANPNLIYPGQVLKVPTNGNSGSRAYTVQKGDTLSSIASRYGTTYQKIAADNGISNPNLIYPGQVLVIK